MVKFYLQQRLSHQNYFVKSRLYLWCTTDFECVLTKMLPSLPYSEFHCHPIKTESSSSQPCHIHTSRTAASARHNFERKDRHPGQKRCPGADSGSQHSCQNQPTISYYRPCHHLHQQCKIFEIAESGLC